MKSTKWQLCQVSPLTLAFKIFFNKCLLLFCLNSKSIKGVGGNDLRKKKTDKNTY